jgi:mRNA interferase MazF
MIRPGDVVTVDFPGATGVKRRPAVVVSTELYHRTRPDVVLGLLTSQITSATQPTDYVLQDWRQAGLRRPSAFRAFLVTMPSGAVLAIGHLSDQDWRRVQGCLERALAVT